jgi:2-polyprenyl-6-methoxyphenol hydroxylase-like FAD-dependent oxidoreductase
MIDAVKDPNKIFRDNLTYVKMDEWVKGRVVLVGDSQHASSPITGMGASMALEDAFVLSQELKSASVGSIDAALLNYSKRRGKRINSFHKQSSFMERWMLVKSPLLIPIRDTIARLMPARYFTDQVEKILKEKI